jgi:hypothetical protein
MYFKDFQYLFLALVIIAILSPVHAAKKPSCSDYSVVLSPTPIDCIKDGTLVDFDFPELEINKIDLGKIFEDNKQKLGSESSGGREVGQQSIPANNTQIQNGSIKQLRCELKVVSNGKKSISFLSIQSFVLSSQDKMIRQNDFKHFLIKGNSFFPQNPLPIDQAPNVNLENYTVKVLRGISNRKITLKLCRNEQKDVSVCTSKTRNLFYLNRIVLKLEDISQVSKEYSISKRLRLSCKKTDN